MLWGLEGPISTVSYFHQGLPLAKWALKEGWLQGPQPSLSLLTPTSLLWPLNLPWLLSLYYHSSQLISKSHFLRKDFVISHLYVCMKRHQISSLTFLRTRCIFTLSLFSETKGFVLPTPYCSQKVQSKWDSEIRQPVSTTIPETLAHLHSLATVFFLQV